MMTDIEFDARSEDLHQRMHEVRAAQDFSAEALQREIEFVNELLTFLAQAREGRAPTVVAQIDRDIQITTGALDNMTFALYLRQRADAVVSGVITIH